MLSPFDLFSVRGRTALVTGGATGLGRVCAEALLSAGARVMIASRKAEACEAAAKELSAFGPCEGFGGTVATEAGVAALAAETRKRADALHILVNNAGVNWGEPFETFPWKAWERVMSVNVAGLFSLTRDLAPMLAASATADRPSTVVNIGSVMGSVTQSEHAYSYAASKAAVHHLTRILAAELAGRQVTVNAIAPGPFPTHMTRFAIGDEQGAKRGARAVPMGRLGRPEDIAGALLFLAGRGGAYTTGAIVPVDGGIAVWAPPPMFGGEE
jgi:NAD(P)-dependent dehydrogenase (short-subunit alcohol dehydrogenase family)